LTVPAQEGAAKMAALTGSASIREKRLMVTLTNPSLDSPVTARVRFAGGARASDGRGAALTHSDMRARNTFQNTDEVRLSSLPVKISNEGLERVAIACTELGGSPTVRLVITQIFCVPREALLRRGATVELRPAF
jgi:alpha-L-arabinofuranosidase